MNSLDIAEMEKVYADQELGKYRIGFGKKPALLIIDFQYGFTDPEYGSGGGNIANALEKTATLLTEVRSKRIPIFYSVAAFRKDLIDGGHFVRKVKFLENFVFGSRYVEVDSKIQPEKEDVLICKKRQSFFAGTDLNMLLKYLAVDTVLISGCTTSGCVRATTNDALAYGYRPMVIDECVGDRSLFAHQCTLMELNAKIADVVKFEEVIQYIENI